MDIKPIFDRVNRTVPISQPMFVDYYNDAVRYLVGTYNEKYIMQTGYSYSGIQHITDEGYVRDEYTQSIIDSILYAVTGDINKLSISRSEAETAYLNIWRKKSYGASINTARTNSNITPNREERLK